MMSSNDSQARLPPSFRTPQIPNAQLVSGCPVFDGRLEPEVGLLTVSGVREPPAANLPCLLSLYVMRCGLVSDSRYLFPIFSLGEICTMSFHQVMCV